MYTQRAHDRVQDVFKCDSPKLLFRVAISLTRMVEHGSDSLIALCLVGKKTFFIVSNAILRIPRVFFFSASLYFEIEN